MFDSESNSEEFCKEVSTVTLKAPNDSKVSKGYVFGAEKFNILSQKLSADANLE